MLAATSLRVSPPDGPALAPLGENMPRMILP
jgi:hypothetical protein